MIRKLAFALSLLGASYTGSVNALGLGEATVRSNLNQPLRAEIELVSASDYAAEEILPGLATREEFLKANVDRIYFLSDIKFSIEKNSADQWVVVLSTKKPVREPFLNFLVEVIWPSGRLLREYALLIDPPVFTEEKAQPIQPSQVSSVSTGDRLAMPVIQAPARSSVADINTSTLGASYGPTGPTDTLWDIALKARPNRSVSPQQVMLAIQDLNPGAFINNNINKLKAGQVLRLPTLDQIKQRSQHEAIEAVIAQNESSRGKQRSKSIASATQRSNTVASPQSVGANKDELKLVVANNEPSNAKTNTSGDTITGSSSGSASDERLAITLEKLDKANIENSELNGRLNDLEEQLQTLQRLLTLKNDQLANIQAQMRANELAKAKVEEGMDASVQAPAESLDSNQLAGGVANGGMSEAVDEEQVAENITQGQDEVAGMSSKGMAVENADITGLDSEAPAKTEQNASVSKSAPVKPAAQASTAASEPESSGNFVEMILNNPLYLAIAIASIIGIVVLLWFVSRNNAKREEEYQASLPEEEEVAFDESEYEEESDDEAAYDGAEESEEDELDNSEEESLETQDDASEEDEDVLAEADVYIAYGRLDQAAAVLETAISKDPVRTDLRLKLLSVYKDSGDVEAFDRQFSELEAIQDHSAIEAASAIRAEMLESDLVSIDDKEHSLELDREVEQFDNAQDVAGSAIEAEAEALENEGQTFDFDSVELDDSDSDIGISAEDLDLDLDEDVLAQADSLADELGEGLENDSLDAPDLGADLDVELDQVAEELSAELGDGLDAELDGDFDDSILDVDLGDIDMSEELDQETEIELPSDLTEEAISSSIAPDSGDLEMSAEEAAGTETASADAPLDDDLGEEGEFDFLEGTDEASTKLDLARAYIDMGDLEGAKDILEEVAKEGNDEQKAEAQNLISQLDV